MARESKNPRASDRKGKSGRKGSRDERAGRRDAGKKGVKVDFAWKCQHEDPERWDGLS